MLSGAEIVLIPSILVLNTCGFVSYTVISEDFNTSGALTSSKNSENLPAIGVVCMSPCATSYL